MSQTCFELRIISMTCAAVIAGNNVFAGDGSPLVHGYAVRQAIEQAADRRIDIVGIGDSNQIRQAHGWDHGMQHAMVELGFDMYATGLMSATARGGPGYQYFTGLDANWWNGNRGTDTGAPVFFAEYMPGFAFSFTHTYIFANEDISDDGFINFAGIQINQGSPLGNESNLRGHHWYGLFDTEGDGLFTPSWRDGPSTNVGLPVAIPTEGHRENMMVTSSRDLPAGSRLGNLMFRYCRQAGDVQWAGRAFIAYHRVENLDRPAGFSYSTWGFHGGEGAEFFADLIMNNPQVTPTYKQYYFEQLRMLQAEMSQEPMVIFWISHSINDRFNKSGSHGPIGGLPSNTPEGYADNLQGIMDQIQEDWVASGGEVEQLYFVIQVGHPLTLETEPPFELDEGMLAFEQGAATVANNNPRTTAVLPSQLLSGQEMVDADYYEGLSTDAAHLVQGAYEDLSMMMIDAILNAGPDADLDDDGTVAGSDLLILINGWGPNVGASDLNRDGWVNGSDLLILLNAWG